MCERLSIASSLSSSRPQQNHVIFAWFCWMICCDEIARIGEATGLRRCEKKCNREATQTIDNFHAIVLWIIYHNPNTFLLIRFSSQRYDSAMDVFAPCVALFSSFFFFSVQIVIANTLHRVFCYIRFQWKSNRRRRVRAFYRQRSKHRSADVIVYRFMHLNGVADRLGIT